MNYSQKVLYVLNQFSNAQYVQKSKLLALLYIVDVETGDSSHYTKESNQMSLRIESNKVENILTELESDNCIEITENLTFGGDTRTEYRITPQGIETIKTHDSMEEFDLICEEYGSYPISNLLKYIQEEYYLED